MSKRYIVVKCGGSTINELTPLFYDRLKRYQQEGNHLVVVHGGGSDVNDMLDIMNVESTFVGGLRRTTPEVLAVADMVFNGKVNPKVCSALQLAGVKTVGLSGCDGSMIQARLLDENTLGLVGEAVEVNTDLLDQLTTRGLTPVISPIVSGPKGSRLNMNADTAAAHYASSLGAREVIFVTNVPGIMKEGAVLPTVSEEEVHAFIDDGTIYGGMIPKVQAAIASLTGAVQKVTIINADGTGQGTSIHKSVVPTV
ncbi:acetylglutamate kinase [Geomicrobium sp. JCM 19039]|uniref:acetylglutamate kinase n=1 Tax=Geomicrobium sp. JCM 19039 TaxID=1460636 RepID=UPI00045F1897|nr:acetylglutamate kinase [Geomicrobium sp. JCM 19039]GAK11832.1 acetylglutamate kinase [Geomicrobium sp. JCM 19039]